MVDGAKPRAQGARGRVHPSTIRAGQVFFSLDGSRRLRFTVKRVLGEWVRVLREDGRASRISLDRLLARDGDRGQFYSFQGWRSLPRGYRTELLVVTVEAGLRRCLVRLPEWDPDQDILQPLSVLPEDLRVAGAAGSCMANLASGSVPGLEIHSCKKSRRGLRASRSVLPSHPDVLAKGQRFRRRSDGAAFRLLDGSGLRVRAWNGKRAVRLDRSRLMETRSDGHGRYYEYIAGGVNEARRARGQS